MKRCMTALPGAAIVASGLEAHAVDITGAGATFPYPIYAKWADAYKTKTGIGMNYQSIGSGGGIKQIQSKTVDFGASDAPLKPEDLDNPGPDAVPGDHWRHRAGGESRRRRARRPEAHRPGARRHLSGQDQELERQGDRGPESRPQAEQRVDHAWSAAPTAPARRSTSPITCRRSAREWKNKVGSAPPSRGPRAWAARATKAWRRTCSGSRAPSATWNTPTRKKNN